MCGQPTSSHGPEAVAIAALDGIAKPNTVKRCGLTVGWGPFSMQGLRPIAFLSDESACSLAITTSIVT
jgi:hypothetical protein